MAPPSLEPPPAIEAISGSSAPIPDGPAEARARRLGLIDGQRTTLQTLAIQSLYGAREVFGLRQLDKAESSRPTSDLVPNDDRRGHLKAGLRNEFVEGSVRRAVGKITYEQFSQLILQLRAALREGPPD